MTWRWFISPNSGFLPADRAVLAHVRVALRHGAEVRAREVVTRIEEAGEHVMVHTSRGRYEAGA